MKVARTSCIIALLAAVFSLYGLAEAAMINYDLTADPNYMAVGNSPLTSGGFTYVYQTFQLADASTGSSQQPARTVAVGDTINGTITFSSSYSPVASVFGERLFIRLQSAVNYGFNFVAPSLSFYNNGALVDTPVRAGQGQGSFPILGTSAYSSGVTPVHTFDTIVFSTTVSRIYDQNFNDVSSVDLISGTPRLEIWSTTVPVPLPAGLWLFVSGIAGIGVFARRKRAAG